MNRAQFEFESATTPLPPSPALILHVNNVPRAGFEPRLFQTSKSAHPYYTAVLPQRSYPSLLKIPTPILRSRDSYRNLRTHRETTHPHLFVEEQNALKCATLTTPT